MLLHRGRAGPGAGTRTVMGAHAAWALAVLAKGSLRSRTTFHRFSVGVWLLWLVPYVGGIVFGVASAGG